GFVAAFSPRIDIPVPTHVVGVDDEGDPIEGPGGYLTGVTADPEALGGVLHCDAGVTSTSWSIGSGTSETHSRLISFIPATTGLYRVVPPSGATTQHTLGEVVFRQWRQDAVVGRAGKRFYGQDLGTPAV